MVNMKTYRYPVQFLKGKILALLALLMSVAPAMQALTIIDNFTTPANWGTAFSQGGGYISVGSGRMNYTSATTNGAGAEIPRNTPLLPTTQNWSLQVDRKSTRLNS